MGRFSLKVFIFLCKVTRGGATEDFEDDDHFSLSEVPLPSASYLGQIVLGRNSTFR